MRLTMRFGLVTAGTPVGTAPVAMVAHWHALEAFGQQLAILARALLAGDEVN